MIDGISNSLLTQQISSNLNAANGKANAVETDMFKKTLEAAKNTQDDAQLKKACAQFEEVFLRMMMKSMRKTVSNSDLVENSFARETYQEMLDNEMVKETAKGEGIGISKMLYQQLKDTLKDNTETVI